MTIGTLTLAPGTRYLLRHRLPGQRHDRYSVLDFLGLNGGGPYAAFSGRPACGTVTLPIGAVLAAARVPKTTACFCARRAAPLAVPLAARAATDPRFGAGGGGDFVMPEAVRSPDPTPAECEAEAVAALSAWRDEDAHGPHTAARVTDLLVNLRFLAAAVGWDFDDMLRQSARSFQQYTESAQEDTRP